MSTRTLRLGSVSGIPEFRVHHWKPEKRNTTIKAYLKIKVPCSDRAWREIVNCVSSAVGAVGIATIISGGPSAFLAVLLPCLAAKGIQLTTDNVRVYTKFSRGSWKRVFKRLKCARTPLKYKTIVRYSKQAKRRCRIFKL